VLPAIENFLKERNLKLSIEKTKIIHINEGFDFLGQNIRKRNGKVLLSPSKYSLRKILDTIQDFIINNKHITQSALINELNLKVIGWLQYHKYTHSRRPFQKIERALRRACWLWAKSKHPSKSKNWIKRKYFIRNKNGDWIFASTIKSRIIKLYTPTQLKRDKYIAINYNYNPYDPEWRDYLKKRKSIQKENRNRKNAMKLIDRLKTMLIAR
jgi:RNA-directed DNA polymerase